jgi:hypothetical protein
LDKKIFRNFKKGGQHLSTKHLIKDRAAAHLDLGDVDHVVGVTPADVNVATAKSIKGKICSLYPGLDVADIIIRRCRSRRKIKSRRRTG